jgi:hypothetical protein
MADRFGVKAGRLFAKPPVPSRSRKALWLDDKLSHRHNARRCFFIFST